MSAVQIAEDDEGFREPDPLNPLQVLDDVMNVLRSDDESAEVHGLDAEAWANEGFAELSELPCTLCVALISPNSHEAAFIRDMLIQKWHSMAEDAG